MLVSATQVDQCPVKQRRVQLFVNQTINDGYLVFDPRPSSSLVTSLAADSTERHFVENQRHGSGSASSQSTAVFDADSRHLAVSGGNSPRVVTPVVGVESCPWTISAKPGHYITHAEIRT